MKTKRHMPPRLFLRFFRWYCHPKLVERIEGDLMEVHQRRLGEVGKQKADRQFIADVLLLFRPAIWKPLGGYKHLNTYGMYKSYFKIGWRNLVRSKGYSLINIGGLAMGMAVAILNGIWIWNEFSWNKNFKNYDRVAHVAETGLDLERGGTFLGTTMTYPLGTALMDSYSQHLKRIARATFDVESIMSVGELKLTSRGKYVDPSALELFSFNMLQGSRKALDQPGAIVISRTLAESMFGTQNPINQTIKVNNKTDLIVSGIFEDFPDSSEFFGLKFFSSWSQYLSENKWIEQEASTDWRNHFIKIYVEIPEGKEFEAIADQLKTALQFDKEDIVEATKRQQQLVLYPMRDWHLHPDRFQRAAISPILMVKWVGAIGMFVLLLACVNFVNLSTARAEKRAKEVGIRKTNGSIRSQLVTQFFSESFLIVSLAFIAALVLATALLPGFNQIASKNMSMPWSNNWFWLASLVFVVFTSVLAGIYPALYLSSFNPIRALKGSFRVGRLAAVPRHVLVVFQFSISIVLIIGTGVVYQQIQFAKNRPVGYDREGLIMINKKSDDFNGKYDILRQELKNTGAVYEISESMGPMTEVYSGNNGWSWNGHEADFFERSFATLSVSHMHGKTVGWQFVKGRDFDLTIPGDSSGLIINESALKVMNLPDPLGEPITWTWWADKSRVIHYKILGVIKDVVMESPYAPTEPGVFYLRGLNGSNSWINIRINPGVSVGDALPKIESVFKKVIPGAPFEYKFADEEYALKFGNEERTARLAGIFAILSILISCLGLLGLASFVAEQRTKEIGIRKVLGASVPVLWKMLSRDFMGLVLIACVVAAPIAYYLLTQWLQRFEYRTTISVWLFVLTGAGALAITLMTVSYQAIKAAMLNPARSLRSE